jgi:predicted nucleic acid-binding protein
LILYLDTSALVKIYVDEPGRTAVMRELGSAVAVATVRIAYAEARAAFARKRREGGLDAKGLRQAVERLDEDWATYSIVDVIEPLVRRAGGLAERHGLRGYDAVHLAAAVEIERAGGEVAFGCFDERLRKAARRVKLRVPRMAAEVGRVGRWRGPGVA